MRSKGNWVIVNDTCMKISNSDPSKINEVITYIL